MVHSLIITESFVRFKALSSSLSTLKPNVERKTFAVTVGGDRTGFYLPPPYTVVFD